ncbi:MAG: hypothetical protein V4580_12850 [Bacteroidota bacterium]
MVKQITHQFLKQVCLSAFGVLVFSSSCYAQDTLHISSKDTLQDPFMRDSLELTRVKRIRPQFKFDNRVAFHGSQGLPINGFDLGLLLESKLRFTVGYYTLFGNLKEFNIERDGQEFTKAIQMNYGSINTELIYKDWRFVSLGMPLEVGAGVNTFRDKNLTTGDVYSTQTGGLLFINFGVAGTFKPMRFLGLKVIAGYRKQVYNQVKDFNFDGFFTSIGLNFDVQELGRDIKMIRLKKKYKKGNPVSNIVNILTG